MRGFTVALGDAYAWAGGESWGPQVPRFSFQWELDWWRQNEISSGNALRALKVPVLAMVRRFAKPDGSAQR